MRKTSGVPERVGDELGRAEFGDARLSRRLSALAERAMGAPDAGFPQMVATDAELEGVYRFLSNEKVTAEGILAPHVDATLDRAAAHSTVWVVHDTTSFEFGGSRPREGLGLMIGSGQGFFAHMALAVAPGEARLALGVLGLEHWPRRTRKHSNGNKKTRQDPERESLRWGRMLEYVEQQRSGRFSCLHVMDREADIIEVLLDARRLGARFVIRSAHDRALGEGIRLRDRIATLQPSLRQTIQLTARTDRGRPGVLRKRHPQRAARCATIGIVGCAVEFSTGIHHAGQPPVSVNVVHVREIDPPQGEAPVDWLLCTTEPVDTHEQLVAIVDAYRARWLIEEFFKALKTGCALEKRQLESYRALSNALAMFIPVAWRLLVARSLARTSPEAPASIVLTPVQQRLLVHKLGLTTPLITLEQATYAVARLGGHLRRNGPPGWQTLGRGFEALLLMQAGWRAAVAAGAL